MNKQTNFPLSNITTLGIGGPAKEFVEVKSEDELINEIKSASQKYLVIGGGSNLLFSDEGFDGLVIKNNISGIEREGNSLKVKAGTRLQELVDLAIDKGLSGLEKLTGIPGTVGGAVYGNAGAYGQIISDHLARVKVFQSVIPAKAGIQKNDWTPDQVGGNNQVIWLTKDECNFSYRNSSFKRNKFVILEVEFELTAGNPNDLQKEADETLEKRLVKYPPGIKCPGSFFKNIVTESLPQKILENIPEEKIMYGKIPAGALLEGVGAKGDRIDGIEIAPYHANLFINKGSGTAKDFYNLAKKYWNLVKQKYEVELEPEVQLINLPPFD